MSNTHFCTCSDLACPNHPTNHDKGCDLCIRKCLALGEIPSCFFKDIHADLSGVEDFSYKGFAAFLKKHGSNQ